MSKTENKSGKNLANYQKEPDKQITIKIIPSRSFQPLWEWTGTIQDDFYNSLYKLKLPAVPSYQNKNSYDLYFDTDEELYTLFNLFKTYPSVHFYKRKLMQYIRTLDILPKPIILEEKKEPEK